MAGDFEGFGVQYWYFGVGGVFGVLAFGLRGGRGDVRGFLRVVVLVFV